MSSLAKEECKRVLLIVRLIPWIAFVLVVGSIWYFGVHQPRKRKKAAGSVSPVSPVSGGNWPAREGPNRIIADDDANRKGDATARRDYWLELRSLLKGESLADKKFAQGGFFSHRAGKRFLVVHVDDDTCVIVRADSPAHAKVTRFVVNMATAGDVAMVNEERIPPEGSTKGIGRVMGDNTSREGAEGYPTYELGFLIGELQEAYRIRPL